MSSCHSLPELESAAAMTNTDAPTDTDVLGFTYLFIPRTALYFHINLRKKKQTSQARSINISKYISKYTFSERCINTIMRTKHIWGVHRGKRQAFDRGRASPVTIWPRKSAGFVHADTGNTTSSILWSNTTFFCGLGYWNPTKPTHLKPRAEHPACDFGKTLL